MRRINLSKRAQKFLDQLPPKQRRQVSGKLLELAKDPTPADSGQLKGFPYLRADIGEYRIICRYDDDVLYAPIVGKRNDDDVYRQLRRLD